MFKKAIREKDYKKANEIIATGNPFKDIREFDISQIYRSLIVDKAFEVTHNLIKNNFIELDIYEYDSFDKSIFKSIVNYLANDNESLAFLNDFLSQVQSINDELGGESLLSYAVENEVDIEILKVMVTNGCNVNIINSAEENLIHKIVKKYVRNYDKSLEYLQFFYDEGLDISKPNIQQKTPLHLAVEFNKKEYIQWLLENGVNPNTQDKDGNSPFFIATTTGDGPNKYHIMRQFDTPEFDQRNNRGESLLYEAVRKMSGSDSDKELLQLLLEDGADIYQPSSYYEKEVSTIDILAEKTTTLLQVVLDSEQLEINQQDNEGNTILHKVCGRETLYEEKQAKEVYRLVKLLIQSGANIHLTNDKNETPMAIASNDNMKTKTVELLLSHK